MKRTNPVAENRLCKNGAVISLAAAVGHANALESRPMS